GHFTMDSASNNSTFMHHFLLLLVHAGILDFDAKDNYIRCFAHIINLCAQATIKNIASIITSGLNLAKTYYKKLEDSNAYIIAMGDSPAGSQGLRNSSRSRGPAVPAMLANAVNKYRNNHGKITWPTIYHLFTDYAPIQATSVPFEQVFSSSAEADTKQQNWLSPPLMEALQMLKFNFKKSRLNFMTEWQVPPILHDDEDWLRQLAATAEEDCNAAAWVIEECFDMADNILMPEEDVGT
ncbi:hypothetical protein C8R44DRAFT_617949, partial [Mycena epipterygia]